MDLAAILIAVVSAGGVIGSAFLQRRSNRDSIRSAEQREVAVRVDQERQRQQDAEERTRERAHAKDLAEQAHRHALDVSDREHERKLSDVWRDQRIEAHTQALAFLEKLVNALFEQSWAFIGVVLKDDEYADFDDPEKLLYDLLSQAPKVYLVASTDATGALRRAVEAASAARWSEHEWARVRMTREFAQQAQQEVNASEKAALEAVGDYRGAAKKDIGTATI